ncbi:MAG: hypothetical protein NT016_03575 [Candidatus Aenigmarchaeota archaeon]|nr:hypothetical protein [Candidatus Aenigmarchaeota archaeon]
MPKYSYHTRKQELAIESTMRRLNRLRWKYKNSMMLVLGGLAAYVVLSSPAVDAFVAGLGAYGYMWSALFGFFHAFSVTIVPSTALLYKLGHDLNPVMISLIAATGAAVGDYFVYLFVRNELISELCMIGEQVSNKISTGVRVSGLSENPVSKLVMANVGVFYRVFPFSNIVASKNIRVRMFEVSKSRIWRPAFIAAASLIIMLPLPNEIGVTMLGLLDFDDRTFLAYVFAVSFVGILGVTLLGAA